MPGATLGSFVLAPLDAQADSTRAHKKAAAARVMRPIAEPPSVIEPLDATPTRQRCKWAPPCYAVGMREIVNVRKQLERAPRLDRSGAMKHMLIASAGATVGITLTITGAAVLILALLALE